MAALSFPASPTNGQVYGKFKFNSSRGVWEKNQFAVISGGTEIDYTDPDGVSWHAHVFTSSGTLTVSSAGLLDTLAVGGGSNYVNYAGRYSWGGGGAVRWGHHNFTEIGDYAIVVGGNTSISKPTGGFVIAAGAGGRVYHNIDNRAYALPGIGGGGSQGGIGINASGQKGGGAGGRLYSDDEWDGVQLYYEGSLLEYGKGGDGTNNLAAGIGAGAGSGNQQSPKTGVVVVRYRT